MIVSFRLDTPSFLSSVRIMLCFLTNCLGSHGPIVPTGNVTLMSISSRPRRNRAYRIGTEPPFATHLPPYTPLA